MEHSMVHVWIMLRGSGIKIIILYKCDEKIVLRNQFGKQSQVCEYREQLFNSMPR